MSPCLYLVPIGAKNPITEPIRVNRWTSTVGRRLDCDIVLESPGVSRLHGVLVYYAELRIALFRDLDSRNGSFKWEIRIEETELLDKERIRFGPVSFIVRFSDDGRLPREDDDSAFPEEGRDPA